jgi:prepilin-type processing-associated H-X9-DG protein
VALALLLWANDNGEAFPMQVLESKGGSHESASKGDVLSTFLVISNELANPKILACPEDPGRKRTNQFGGVTRNSLSYFVAVDVSPTNGNRILTGDRNICVAGKLTNGLISIVAPGTVSWTPLMHKGNGNVALADGSAHQITTSGLQQLLRCSAVTNRFIIP